ncbi:hypothetical protein HMPREF1033_01075 [Tannerella sp. 6_1_58FAA_CT1]|nr:hypothetical protein HMPREF1033_01075 [Tannerella sp. 6_1_58FAA_CT1]
MYPIMNTRPSIQGNISSYIRKKRADPSRTGSLKNEKVVFNYEQKGLSAMSQIKI